MDFPLSFSRRFFREQERAPAHFKTEPDDFIVDENLGFAPSGEGEHLYIQIRKKGQNTQWVKEQISRQLSVKPVDIGHSGLKDRHAITTQWLSLHVPKSEPDLGKIAIESVEILQAGRHPQKLRPGTHQSNHFKICLRDFSRSDLVEDVLAQVAKQGFANYFGGQRFGIRAANLQQGWELLQRRKLRHHRKKSIYLSALRAYVFNQVLSTRLTEVNKVGFEDTGPLWGRGLLNVHEEQAAFEKNALVPWSMLCEALEYSGLQQERRLLYITPDKFEYQWQGQATLCMEFELPPGVYATALLAEIAELKDAAR